MKIEDIARICHEANRAYCVAIGDLSQVPWERAPKWQRDSAINGVRFHLIHRDAKPSHSHEEWLRQKQAEGWKYGPVKRPRKKEHPCFLAYSDLPMEHKIKDSLFISVVNVLRGFVES